MMTDLENYRMIRLNKFFFISLCLMIVSFTFSIAVNSISLALLFLFFLIDYRHLKSNLSRYIHDSRNILLLTLFTLLLISLWYSANQQQGVGKVIGYLPMLALPLALTKLNNLPKKFIYFLKDLHIFSCLTASIYCIIKVIIDSGLIDGSYKSAVAPHLYLAYFVHRFTYHQLSEKLHLHAVYFSFFIVVCQFLIIFIPTHSFKKLKWWKPSLLVYFSIVLVLLKSVVINFAFYSFLLLYFYFNLSFKNIRHHVLFYTFSICSSALIFYLFILKNVGSFAQNLYLFDNSVLNQQFLQVVLVALLTAITSVLFKLYLSKRLQVLLIILFLCGLTVFTLKYYQKKSRETLAATKQNEGINNVDARSGSWNSAWMIIKEHPILGIGIGDTEDALMAKYKQINFEAGLQNQFNVHNQYLEFWLASGVTALLCFTLLLLTEGYKAIKENNIMLLSFLYVFVIFCFTESVINRQVGRIFFLFFLCLLGNSAFRKTPTIVNTNH